MSSILLTISLPIEKSVQQSILQACVKQELRDDAEERPEDFGAFVLRLVDHFLVVSDPEYCEYLGKLLVTLFKYPEIAYALSVRQEAVVNLSSMAEILVAEISSVHSTKAACCLIVLHGLYHGLRAEEKELEGREETEHRRELSFRQAVRQNLIRVLVDYGKIPSRSTNISPILILYEKILLGIRQEFITTEYLASSPVRESVQWLLERVLLQLLMVNGWQVFDRQEPFLSVYWKSLISCIDACIDILHACKDCKGSGAVLQALLLAFPGSSGANSAKELLLWTGIRKFLPSALEYLENFPEKLLLDRIIMTLASENANAVQSALSLWREDTWKSFVNSQDEKIVQILLRGILRDGKVHWNPTVNKMTALVLDAFAETDLLRVALQGSHAEVVEARSDVESPVEENWRDFSVEISDRRHPPLGITENAPWKKKHVPFISQRAIVELNAQQESAVVVMRSSDSSNALVSVFLTYREALASYRPVMSEMASGKSWEEALSAASTVQLPTLKYHDLVFGRELGRGSFGVVKYARAVDKKTSISAWPEFAVKIVELRHANVLKEVAILNKLYHPGIARLISFFSLSSPPSIVAVLEYGALGDLQTYVTTQGALIEEELRQVGAEIAGALQTVHAAGFAYADCKAENVVVLFNRHVKITDFGAVVPVTSDAKNLLYNENTKIRTGDWNQQQVNEFSYQEISRVNPEFLIEGTPAYMAPELFHGDGLHFPNFLSDAWSFGALLYFLATARLPVHEDELNHTPTVQFEAPQLQASRLTGLSVQSVIEGLMEVDVSKRLTLENLDSIDFFAISAPLTSAYTKSLPKHHLKNAGSRANVAPDPWSKRQLSRVWTSLPADLDLPDERSLQLSTLPADSSDLQTFWF